MDIKETYTWLNRSRRCDSEIRRMRTKVEELKSCLLASGIDYSKDRVQSSPDDLMGKIFAEIDETEREMKNKALEKGILISEITDAIDSLDSELEKTVLTDFFIAQKSVTKIGKELNYDRSWINKQKKEGVKNLCSIVAEVVEQSSEKMI